MAQVGIRGPYQESSYAVCVQSSAYDPVDGETRYIGQIAYGPTVTAGIRKIYIRAVGIIKRVEIFCWASTAAGTNEDWSLYVRVNGATDYLIATVSLAAATRVFSNSFMNVPLVNGDYFEIKIVQPVWVTNPTGVFYAGYVYIE